MPAKKLVVRRKWKLASALMPYWIITRVSKEDFMQRFLLEDDVSCDVTDWEQAEESADFCPWEWGVPIGNGKTLELEIEEDVSSVFAVTMGGLLSNEIILDSDQSIYQILLTTKGGWKEPSYPRLLPMRFT